MASHPNRVNSRRQEVDLLRKNVHMVNCSGKNKMHVFCLRDRSCKVLLLNATSLNNDILRVTKKCRVSYDDREGIALCKLFLHFKAE